MKILHAATLAACMAVGPCMTFEFSREYTVHQYYKGEIDLTVNKEESIDAELSGKLTGIEASASATANIGNGSTSAKDAVEEEVASE